MTHLADPNSCDWEATQLGLAMPIQVKLEPEPSFQKRRQPLEMSIVAGDRVGSCEYLI